MPTDSSKLWRPDKEMLSVVPGKEFQGALLLPAAGGKRCLYNWIPGKQILNTYVRFCLFS